MPVFDIADITKSIIKMMDIKLRPALGRPAGTGITVPIPPDRMSEEGLCFFLYHVQENNAYRNIPTLGSDQPPVRFTPMALKLYYQLSAFTEVDPDNEDIYTEQLMMGTAMKTLHDYPEITEDTQIFDPQTNQIVTIQENALIGKNNRIKISLLPTPSSEAINYWTAGNSAMRLAAYYEIGVVFLEPEKPKTYSGRVLSYGTYVFTEGAPKITASESTLEFLLPSGVNQQVNVQPAQAAYDDAFSFFGDSFSGDQIDMVLYHADLKNPIETDGSWQLNLTPQNILAVTIGRTGIQKDPDDNPVVVDVLPGIYSAQIKVRRNKTLHDGTTKDFFYSSNQFPFTLAPKIDAVADQGNGIINVTGEIFEHIDYKEEDLVLYLGEKELKKDNALPEDTYRIVSASTIEIHLDSNLATGLFLPLRILIRGAESAPSWIST